ncbi:MAG TPA: hypothetical protein VE174_03940 [Actinomycetota bacterium]|nr:hypothetical protein [Actinomycetota bacterium]
MEADISGSQRKIIGAEVRPNRALWGASGISTRDGVALPFRVSRRWNAPAGYYLEQWFLVDPQSREIVYEGPSKQRLIWGLQSWTEVLDEIEGGFSLAAGKYQIVFALGGVRGGEVEVEVAEAPAEAA